MMVESTRLRLNASAYFQLPEYEQHDLIQLIDGEVVIGMPSILKHQAIVGEIFFLFLTIVRKIGGKAYTSPVEVFLDENNVYEPDVVFVVPANLAITQQDEKRIVGAPNLIMEVLSPSTASYDRQEKYHAYEQYGVSEYWIVDPVHETIEVWTLDESGQFSRQGAYGKARTFQSVTLSTTVTVKPIFDV